MKKIFNIPLLTVLALILAIASCKDYTELAETGVPSGEADFSNYIAVGNSLTAGFQSGALYQSAQKFSYPNLLARQFHDMEAFTQPLISDPGIGGRIELTSLNPLAIARTQEQGQPINQSAKPFSNLGVPGAVLVDYANPNNMGMLKERATNPSHPAFNPFYSIVLEQSELNKAAPNIHNQVAKQSPSFITFWLGNNDVLGYVTSGGEGQNITPPSQFNQLYQASAQLMSSTGAEVVVYNIPDVTSIPFVFLLRSQLEQQGAITFNETTQSYQMVTQQGNFDIYINVDGTPQVMRQDDFLLLSGQSYFSQVASGSVPPPVQPQHAIPDQLVLDGNLATQLPDSELEQAAGAVMQYNAAIQNIAAAFNFALVDVNGIFNQIITNFRNSGGSGGYQADELTLQPIPGSLFSFDGVHISNRGSAVVANETIQVINDFFGAEVETIDVSDIPMGLPVVDE